MSGIGSYAPQYMSNGGDATTPVRTNGVVAGVPLITGATTIPVTGITSIDAMGTPLSAEQIEAARRAAGATAGQGKGPAGAGAQSKTPYRPICILTKTWSYPIAEPLTVRWWTRYVFWV